MNLHNRTLWGETKTNLPALKLKHRVSDTRSATRVLKQKSKRCRMVKGRRRGLVASIRWMNQGMPRQALFNQWGGYWS